METWKEGRRKTERKDIFLFSYNSCALTHCLPFFFILFFRDEYQQQLLAEWLLGLSYSKVLGIVQNETSNCSNTSNT